MCVKLPPRDLNPGPCPPHPTSIYTYRMTTTPRVCGVLKVLSIVIKLALLIGYIENVQSEFKSLSSIIKSKNNNNN